LWGGNGGFDVMPVIMKHIFLQEPVLRSLLKKDCLSFERKYCTYLQGQEQTKHASSIRRKQIGKLCWLLVLCLLLNKMQYFQT
jgi:hypothetical protein